jgi:hypothetical protein
MADLKVKVLSPIEHDGKRVEPGKTVSVPEETAEALVSAGAAEPVTDKVEPPEKKPAK